MFFHSLLDEMTTTILGVPHPLSVVVSIMWLYRHALPYILALMFLHFCAFAHSPNTHLNVEKAVSTDRLSLYPDSSRHSLWRSLFCLRARSANMRSASLSICSKSPRSLNHTFAWHASVGISGKVNADGDQRTDTVIVAVSADLLSIVGAVGRCCRRVCRCDLFADFAAFAKTCHTPVPQTAERPRTCRQL